MFGAWWVLWGVLILVDGLGCGFFLFLWVLRVVALCFDFWCRLWFLWGGCCVVWFGWAVFLGWVCSLSCGFGLVRLLETGCYCSV